MAGLYIVIPAYNEEKNIESVLDGWYKVLLSHNEKNTARLVLVDDGSTDNTRNIVKNFAVTHPYVELLSKENGGHGAAVYAGYVHAINNNAEYIFQTDSDGQTLPEEFEAFWEKRNDFSVLIGERKNRQDGVLRILAAKVLRGVLRLCFGVKVKDVNTPYRLMNGLVLKEEMAYVPESFYLTNALLSALFAVHHRRICFMPITFRKRQGGKNSVNPIKLCKIGVRTLKDFYKIGHSI